MKLIERKKEFKKKITKAKTIFIMAHKDLDLDALGSSIGLYFILEKLNKNCYLIINDNKHESGVNKVLQELEGCLNIIKSTEIEKSLYIREKKNLLIILDTNKKELVQANDALDYFNLDNIIILDHHELGETSIESNLRIIDNEISSTCEMITNLIESYKMELDPYYATLLLSGIVLDTNNFTLKTNSETYYAAYYLSSMGASTKKVQYLLKQDLKEYIERQQLITNVDIIDAPIPCILPAINIVAIVIKNGNLPLHGTKLFVKIAISLSLGELIILHPTTPAALQPNPIHIVIICLPCTTTFFKETIHIKSNSR